MSSVRLSTAILFCMCMVWTSALPKRPASNGASSGAGEIPEELAPDYYPFDGPLGKGSPGNKVFNNYDLDSEGGPRAFPEYDVNDINPDRPQEGGSEDPLKPDDRLPEDKHPEEEDHEPSSHGKPKGGEETHEDEEEETEIPGDEEEKPLGSEEEKTEIPGSEEEKPRGFEEEDTHAVEDEKKPQDGEEEDETQEGEEEVPLPFKPALFSFKQVNHYIKQLEKAMDHVFKETLEDAAFLNNTFANTTEEEVEVNGHKYKVQKSIIETGDEDSNSTLHIEAISSVNEDEPKKNKSKRSNPDAVLNQ